MELRSGAVVVTRMASEDLGNLLEPELETGRDTENQSEFGSQGAIPGADPRLEQLIRLVTAQTRTSTSGVSGSSSSRIRIADLPEFKGVRNHSDSDQFLLELKDLFRVYNTPYEDQGFYAAQAINKTPQSPAASWLAESRDQRSFVDPSNPSNLIDFHIFSLKLKEYFRVPLARRLQLEDLWDRFAQKSLVEEHYVKFNKVLKQLRDLGVTIYPDSIASKFLRSLKPEIRELVLLRFKDDSIPTIQEIYSLSLQCEYQVKLNPAPPRLNAILGGAPLQKPTQNPANPDSSRKWCIYHKSCDHNTDECPKVKQLKEAGKWKTKPSKATTT